MSRVTNRLGWGVAGALGIALVAALGGIIYAGPLDPPGPPSATGPTQIFSIPLAGLTISTSGSYIVEAELTGAPGAAGITITAPDVTLNLNGFALVGPAGLGVERGIDATATGHVSVRNGIIRDWGGPGLYAPGGQGEYANLTFDHVGANVSMGVYIWNSSLSDCEVMNSGKAGGSAVFADYGSTVMRCELGNNLGDALQLSRATATNVAATNNGGAGIVALQDSAIAASTASQNGGSGITLTQSTVTGSTANGNIGTGIELRFGSTAAENTASFNILSGIHVTGNGSRIENNSVASNGGRGIWIDLAGHNNSVVNDTVSGNTQEGILIFPGGNGNLIDSNHSSGNTSNNIAVDNVLLGAQPNVITRNWAILGGAGNYAIGANNDAAPVTTAAAAVNPMANIAQ